MKDSILDFKKMVKEALIVDMNKALEIIRDSLKPTSDSYNEFILLSSNYNRLQRNFHDGLIEFKTYDMEMNKILSYILRLVDSISVNELEASNSITGNINFEEIIISKLFRISFLGSVIYLYSIIDEDEYYSKIKEFKEKVFRYVLDLDLTLSYDLIDNISRGGNYYQIFLSKAGKNVKRFYSDYYKYFKMGSNILGDVKEFSGRNFSYIIEGLRNLPSKYYKVETRNENELLKIAFEIDKHLENRIIKLETIEEG